MDDFDSSLSLEDSFYKEGYEEGTEAGKVQGIIEGRVYGSEISYKRFAIIGRLYGRVSVWQVQHGSNPRVMKHLSRLSDLLYSVPRDNEETREGADYETLLSTVITKMKLICSLTGEDSLIKQGILPDETDNNDNPDLEDGAEIAVRLRGGQRKGCAS